ncbi:carbohydrate sulfotransferase 11-like [Arctopsyche grandis]|uniref:carbohydrate sulfotransferase 11-like n=1 Tax=Arctopsyche grandis TaxID=121162 RepID=UPI00406D8556
MLRATKNITFIIIFLYAVILIISITVYNESEMKRSTMHFFNANFFEMDLLNMNENISIKQEYPARHNKKSLEPFMLERQMRIKNYCSLNIKETNMQYGVTRRLMIDSDDEITWCPICKAGSTIWMKVFAVLGSELDPNIKLPNKDIQVSKLAKKAYPYLGAMRVYDLLNTSKKFMIVRHPFERLLSAFRDKLEDVDKTYYHEKYGKYIMKWYRVQPDDRAVPYFEEFLKYIVNEKSFDEHWRPYFQECAPCFVDYDIILKMESFENDMKYLINYLDNENIRQIIQTTQWNNTNPSGRTDIEITKEYFSNISTSLLKDIYNIYEKDFILFDYEPDEYFTMTKKI